MKEGREPVFFKQLEALRFAAFLAVFSLHVFTPRVTGEPANSLTSFIYTYSRLGFLGIDFFFVLSSFLISFKFFEEASASGNFNLKKFLIRRVLRIWPLYFLIVILGIIAIYFNNSSGGSSEMPPLYHFLFFTINFYIAANGNFFLFFLVFLWSIAVEEQFYVLWAVFFKYLKSYFIQICLMMIFLSLAFRAGFIKDHFQLYYNSLSVAGDFGIGGLLGYCCFHKNSFYLKTKKISTSTIILIYLMFLAVIIFYNQLFSYSAAVVIERLIFSIFFAFIIFEQVFCKHSLFKAGKSKAINYLGKISYGLYCFHGVVITAYLFLNVNFPPKTLFFTVPLLIFIATVALAILSYEFFEKRFLILKTSFYPSF